MMQKWWGWLVTWLLPKADKLLGVYIQKHKLCFNLNTTEIAIFGVPEQGLSLTNNVKNVIAFASLLARIWEEYCWNGSKRMCLRL